MKTQQLIFRALALSGLFAAVLIPFMVESYTAWQVSQYLAFVIAVLGLNVLAGYSGQLSLGHGAFVGIGAYAAAVLISPVGAPYGVAVPAAAVVCAVFGYLIGFPALRLSGHYLALATFGLALSLPQLIKFKGLEFLLGGTQGIVLPEVKPLYEMSLFGVALKSEQWIYYLTLGTTLLVFLMCSNILKGRVGRAFIALRDHPIAAETMGINVSQYKAIAFAISAFLAGLAGALLAISTAFVAPDNFNAMLSIALLVGAVVGGVSTVWGALFGGLFVQVMPNLMHELSTSAPNVIYGSLLLVVIYLMPAGLMGLFQARLGRGALRHPRS